MKSELTGKYIFLFSRLKILQMNLKFGIINSIVLVKIWNPINSLTWTFVLQNYVQPC